MRRVLTLLVVAVLFSYLLPASQAKETFVTRLAADLSRDETMVLVEDGSKLDFRVPLIVVDRDSGRREDLPIRHIHGNNVHLKTSASREFLAGSAVLQLK